MNLTGTLNTAKGLRNLQEAAGDTADVHEATLARIHEMALQSPVCACSAYFESW